jgi:signal transduction histidine kinase
MDIDDRITVKLLAFTWRFSLIYTVCLLLAIFVLVAYLHLRYIRRSLFRFRKTIEQINKGDLSIRLDIPAANELGSLGLSFNEMLDTFEDTQVQLQAYHRQELQTSKKLATIGEMSARIAHEIRNPVTGIARAMEIIMADLKDDSNKPILEEIQRQAGRVEEAVSNLLKYSRSQEPRISPGDINEVIRSLVFFLKHQAHEKPVVFEFEPGADIPQIEFDPELIENVLLNLSFNAMKSMGADGTIVFATRFDADRQRITISVHDNGTGISPEIAGDIFKPFFTTHTKGTGLGLAISKDIVEKHGGRIWFENNRNGIGCTFFMELPQRPREI